MTALQASKQACLCLPGPRALSGDSRPTSSLLWRSGCSFVPNAQPSDHQGFPTFPCCPPNTAIAWFSAPVIHRTLCSPSVSTPALWQMPLHVRPRARGSVLKFSRRRSSHRFVTTTTTTDASNAIAHSADNCSRGELPALRPHALVLMAKCTQALSRPPARAHA